MYVYILTQTHLLHEDLLLYVSSKLVLSKFCLKEQAALSSRLFIRSRTDLHVSSCSLNACLESIWFCKTHICVAGNKTSNTSAQVPPLRSIIPRQGTHCSSLSDLKHGLILRVSQLQLLAWDSGDGSGPEGFLVALL